MENRLKKNFIWNMLGMTFNSFNSLFFLIIVTRINTIDNAGVFNYTFSLACLLFFIGTYSGRVFQVTDIDEKHRDQDYITQRIITCGLMMICTVIYGLFMNYSSYTFWMLLVLSLYKCIEALSDVFYGILQKNHCLYKAGISLVTKSILSIVLFFLIDYMFRDICLSVISMIVVWGIVLIIYDIPKSLEFTSYTFGYNHNVLVSLFKSGFFIFIINFLSVYIVNAPKYALNGMVEESYQAIFGIIVMPATLVSLAAQYFIQPFLENMTNAYKNSDLKGFIKIIIKLSYLIIGFGIICMLGAYFLGIPVLSLVYAVNLDGYLFDLELILLASVFYALSIILSAALTTTRHTISQLFVYATVSVMSIFVANFFITNFHVHGAFYLYLLIMFSQFVLYFLVFLYYLFSNRIFKYDPNSLKEV